jgi:RNA polymerase primary sigma factor
MLKIQVESALMELNARERQVLRMRFGLEDGRDRTLGEIGEELGVSRERVRQIEAEALAKLRHPKLRNRLREYIDG